MGEEQGLKHPHKRRLEEPKNTLFKVRNILNTIFIIGAIIGVAMYYASNRTVGTIVILSSIVFKLVESCLRFFHK